jgi:ferredoxin--NADP+ reductase
MISSPNINRYTVAIVGAGPAGLFAAKELANNGVQVLLFNRDIKIGGLAEYGIYPDKIKMKEGLRNQFRQIMANPNISYFGNIRVGKEKDITIQDLREMGVHAILVSVGAQGTKWLGIPGENLHGVYHAKDVVYHYNRLPPFSQKEFKFGKRVALIGVGNVMMDVAHWLTHNEDVNEITILARRGPAETKFDINQLEYVVSNLDLKDLDAEILRVGSVMRGVGQDPEVSRAKFLSALEKAEPKLTKTRIMMRFLKSPSKIVGDFTKKVTSLILEDNTLDLQNAVVTQHGLGTFSTLDIDSIIFAIGDRVDQNIGLPITANEFVKAATPRFPVYGDSFEVFDPSTGKIIEDLFVAGWSRKASNGLVGIARKDGVNCAQAINQFLESLNSVKSFHMENIDSFLARLTHPIVDKEALQRLEAIEIDEAQKLGLEDFKFISNDAMLTAIGLSMKTESY